MKKLRDDELKISRRKTPVIGQRFSRLVVIAGPLGSSGKRTWLCQCDCGGTATPRTGNLNGGISKSCGCQKAYNFSTTHGMHKSGAYKSWTNMHHRCKCEPSYLSVTICERWSKFELFFEDMGERPAGHSIDRIDNNLGYEPANCRWATAATQAQNRLLCKKYEYRGEFRYLGEWANLLGFSFGKLRGRIRSGLTLDQAVALGRDRIAGGEIEKVK